MAVADPIPKVQYRPHPKQADVHKSSATNRVVVAGRQSGKTLVAIHEESVWAQSAPATWPDAKFPQFWWVTASYKTKGKAWRDFAANVPRDIIRRKHESETWFELGNGSRITMRSADAPESLVSETLHGLVCDEFCQYRSGIWYDQLAPMLATTGGPVIFTGTPKGHNWGYDIYQNATRGIPGWASFHWTVYDSPYVARQWIEQRRLETPERSWQQEYLAEFLTDGGEVFRNIDGAIRPIAQPDDYNVIGFDLARTHDWSHLYAFNSKGEWIGSRRVGHLDWSVQRIAVIEMTKRLGARKVLVDVSGLQNEGEAVIFDLQNAGVPAEGFRITAESKRALIENLMWRFDMGAISIAIETAEQFREFTVEQLDSGYERYSAPEGKHDDEVMAGALGMWALRHMAVRQIPDRPKGIVEQELERLGWDPERGGRSDRDDGQGWWG
jgi:hypothetical protein